ncbi:MAG: hypothetical protein A3B37_01020 [Candidatus Sungbacteria bacterium RIFCSPLOWO2_01_FULL_59_16]|uniref:Uncharacterized protein n=1 Tax=Candidatus Sungbacteria bacterium RIFCSPLOWO2_01_FULL_59_16 TaxID=1802280 RepID=A0A1G2LE81_9BACT|nr:MAG: hypothetical protein A3B37_01020 [Candidatus Sungbacteria bacterium RIFCSPLOWO2_01_FULL_59_16]
MGIMIAPQAPVIARLPYGRVESGFMRNHRGEIFFLWTHGRETIHSPVLEDGTIYPSGDFLWPDQVVNLVHPRDLGISEIRWAEPHRPA